MKSSSKQFYQDNRVYSPRFAAPRQDSTNLELTNWLFSRSFPPYLELDMSFDLDTWKTESDKAVPYLVNHREGGNHNGWKSCCIHGIDIDKTGVWNVYSKTEPEYRWTELSDKTPSITSFWKNFPAERFARIRFMMLEPHGHVEPHNDTPPGIKVVNYLDHLVPINVAIDHPDDCYMTLEKHGIVPWKNGDMKIVNITNTHSVINMSDKPRMHMIAHAIIGNRINEFSELVARSYRKQYERHRVR